ncbi:hypothetical protein AK812_SmicGene15624 [Symbiodinium microadriaticum]|uniref:Reverse transcriptase Ty1/copia-type domain-containing protein n=1 Tax=Symbiodinium microadriaticum TaxID=2951 RepID=A0A1Q9E2J1_SYMMI|nr:hypothetical protein AK812_SmicGene15624 [Symbiodinium microadriaticum]
MIPGDYREAYEVQVSKVENPQAPEVFPRSSATNDSPVEGHEAYQVDEASEQTARELWSRKDFSMQACESLLKSLSLPNRGTKTRNIVGNNQAQYGTFGAYSYGSQYGVTKLTEKQPWVTRYLNSFLQKQLKPTARWSSFTVSCDNQLPVHRDVNNHQNFPNYLVGLGSYTGGELWVEGTSPEQPEATCPQVRADGSTLWGHTKPTRHRVVEFNPKVWHSSCKWEGTRIVITAFMTRGYDELGEEIQDWLQKTGFQGPPVWKPKFGTVQKKEEERIKRDLRNSACSEPSTLADGQLMISGRQLIKCAPEHLRHASTREELIEALTEENTTPWTYNRVVEQIGGNQYEDLTGTPAPTMTEWHRAQDPSQESQPTRRRIVSKRPAPEPADEEMPTEEPSGHLRRPRVQAPTSSESSQETHLCWWNMIPESEWSESEAVFWNEESAAVAVELDMPDSKRGWQKALNNLEGFFTGTLKKKSVEVCERRLTPAERAEFQAAKATEVRNFIASEAFKVLPPELQPNRSQAVGMRWKAMKGDVSGAFLQGRPYPDLLHCVPTDEICTAMGIPSGSVTRLQRACYGLVDAPLEWYRTVTEFLDTLGLERLWSDACMWVWRPAGEVRGIITGHVDDFLFGGSEQDVAWQAILDKIKAKFRWGDWEEDQLMQCGVQITQTAEGFELSQSKYVQEHVQEIPISSSRRKMDKATTSDKEKSALRATLGALSWHAQQVAPHISAEVGLLLSEVSQSTVSTIIRTNILVQHTRARKDYKIMIHRFAPSEELCLYAWVDAGSQNRPDGGRAAETLAAVNGEDVLYFCRFQMAEIERGCVITESRNVYDKMSTEVLSIKGAEKRSNIEMIGLKEAQQRVQAGGAKELEMFYKMQSRPSEAAAGEPMAAEPKEELPSWVFQGEMLDNENLQPQALRWKNGRASREDWFRLIGKAEYWPLDDGKASTSAFWYACKNSDTTLLHYLRSVVRFFDMLSDAGHSIGALSQHHAIDAILYGQEAASDSLSMPINTMKAFRWYIKASLLPVPPLYGEIVQASGNELLRCSAVTTNAARKDRLIINFWICRVVYGYLIVYAEGSTNAQGLFALSQELGRVLVAFERGRLDRLCASCQPVAPSNPPRPPPWIQQSPTLLSPETTKCLIGHASHMLRFAMSAKDKQALSFAIIETWRLCGDLFFRRSAHFSQVEGSLCFDLGRLAMEARQMYLSLVVDSSCASTGLAQLMLRQIYEQHSAFASPGMRANWADQVRSPSFQMDMQAFIDLIGARGVRSDHDFVNTLACELEVVRVDYVAHNASMQAYLSRREELKVCVHPKCAGLAADSLTVSATGPWTHNAIRRSQGLWADKVGYHFWLVAGEEVTNAAVLAAELLEPELSQQIRNDHGIMNFRALPWPHLLTRPESGDNDSDVSLVWVITQLSNTSRAHHKQINGVFQDGDLNVIFWHCGHKDTNPARWDRSPILFGHWWLAGSEALLLPVEVFLQASVLLDQMTQKGDSFHETATHKTRLEATFSELRRHGAPAGFGAVLLYKGRFFPIWEDRPGMAALGHFRSVNFLGVVDKNNRRIEILPSEQAVSDPRFRLFTKRTWGFRKGIAVWLSPKPLDVNVNELFLDQKNYVSS